MLRPARILLIGTQMLLWLMVGCVMLFVLWLTVSWSRNSAESGSANSAESEFSWKVPSPFQPSTVEIPAPAYRRLAADERFRSRIQLLSPAELSFFGTLRLALSDEFLIFSKVRMADVLEPVETGKQRKLAFNEISQKHVDFLICRSGTSEIVCGVELDDSSHRRNQTVVRDIFVGTIFEGAGIPLIRVPVRQGYSVQELTRRFMSVTGSSDTRSPAEPQVKQAAALA